MPTKTINLEFLLDAEKTNAGANKVTASLKAVEEQANKTREKMEKLTQVGTKLALVGGAILAPLALAMKKYVDTVKDAEPVSRRITQLSQKWEQSQVRLGRITAEAVLPALEKGAQILESIIAFAEKNPGVVKAALTIGSTLVVLGGLIATTAQLVSTVATIQGLAASAGLASAGGGAVAGAAAGGGLAAAVSAGIGMAGPALIGALALAIGGQIGLGLGNALAGTNQTWSDILETARKLAILVKIAWIDMLPKMIGQALQALGAMIGNALKGVGDWITSLFRGGKAAGGYMGNGIYAVGEHGKEYVLNNSMTKKFEGLVGGNLSTSNLDKWLALQVSYQKKYAEMQKYLYSYYQPFAKNIKDYNTAFWKAIMSRKYPQDQLNAMIMASGSNLPYDTKVQPGSYVDTKIKPGDYMNTMIEKNQYQDFYFGRRPRSNQVVNIQVGHGMTISQTKRLIANNSAAMLESLLAI